MNSTISSSCKIRILNHLHGETICYPLVLLEGIIIVTEHSCSVGHRRLLRTSGDPESDRADKLQILDSSPQYNLESFQEDTKLLVKCNCHQVVWPVVKAGFKAVVPLKTGENLIVLKLMHNEDIYIEFKLIYTPLQISRFVRIVYVKCADSDGSFDAPANVPCDVNCALKKLSLNAQLLQTFTAESLYQHGLGHKTFRIEEDESGSPKVHIFTSKLTSAEALSMNGDQLYNTFFKELKCSNLYDPMCKFWTFMSCTHYDPPPSDQFDEKLITKYVKAHTALGGGYLALFGTGGLHTWASSIEELVPCFTDARLINKLELFDDSGGRGTYWANYATGLGASMHELGHCFDLAHTPKGIMGRGFDDMNGVWTMWRKPSSIEKDLIAESVKPVDPEKCTNRAVATSAPVSTTGYQAAEALVSQSEDRIVSIENTNLATPSDWNHGAHWDRSSAVLLSYHKWLSTSSPEGDGVQSVFNNPLVHWCHNVCGPVGNSGGCHQKNQQSFNSVKWLESQGAALGGFVIHTGEYVNCIQIIGNQGQSGECQEVLSDPHGTDSVGKRYIFTISSPDEYIKAIDVRAGGWIDAIRLHTNQKSSIWMGGVGGDEYHLKAPPGRCILGIIGTSGEFVGSLGALLSSDSDLVATKEDVDDKLVVDSPNGIRLIELWNKSHSEVYKHWEFLQPNPPITFTLSRRELMDNASTLLVEDDKGNIGRTGFVYDYSDIL